MPSAVIPSDLNRLLLRSLALRQLYRRAAKISEPGLGVVLRENAQTLSLLIAEMQQQMMLAGARPSHRGSWSARLYNYLTVWLLTMSRAGDAAWLRVLAHREASLLQRFERSLTGLEPPWSRLLQHQLVRLQGLALDMHSLVGPQGR